MTIRYVGPGGADGNSGLTWALRKLTLNGVEDTPVVAGDTVYVGPGVYREQLTVDVSGGAGTPITYIGDVSGENTDDVGGIVRITGSDNDQSGTRASCIVGSSGDDYRTFRGFYFDTTTSHEINAVDVTNWIIEDCYFDVPDGSGAHQIVINGASCADWIVRRCHFEPCGYGIGYSIRIFHSSTVDDTGHLFENLTFILRRDDHAFRIERVGGFTIKNCTFIGGYTGVRVVIALTVGQSITVSNCLFHAIFNACWATALGEIIEDYNTFYSCNTDRNTVAVGANSLTYPPLFVPRLLLDGYKYPIDPMTPNEWSQISRRMDYYDDPIHGVFTGISVVEDDLLGIYRPTGVSLLSWGALQLREGERETGTKRTGTAAINLDSAGDHQLFVPVTNVSTTIEVYVYREANYEGLAPQMIIRQPGQDDEVVTDTGASGAWNQLTKTLTPAADPPYVCVILRSHNEALAGNFDVFFDDLDVS